MLSSRILVWALLTLVPLAGASSGDTAEPFKQCLAKCSASLCTLTKPTILPLVLRLTRWTCPDDCKYDCMHRATNVVIQDGRPVRQYYGKWPFWRFLGMQEPASVAFSLLNLWGHYAGGRHLLSKLRRDHPMYGYYISYIVIGMNAWVWSAVFHSRDKPVTEKLDYFSAGLTILYSLYIAVVRLFRLYRPPRFYLLQQSAVDHPTHRWLPPRHILLHLWGALCSLLFLAHIIYLSVIPRFDYSYNIIANVIVGISHNLLWSSYSTRRWPFRRFDYQPQSYIPSYGWMPAVISLLTTMATMLELFDFPPWWRIIDAHSLWHLSTVPLLLMWYRFLALDASDPGWFSGKSVRD